MGKWVANGERKSATEFTRNFLKQEKIRYGAEYDTLEDAEYEEVVKRTVVDFTKEQTIKDDAGNVLRSRAGTEFLLEKENPDTVNPHLWHNSIHNYFSGIVEIVKGKYYVVVGTVEATVNFVRSDHGWIILDTAMSVDGLEYVTRRLEAYLGEQIHGKIKAVVYSHTHLDHYGGTAALVKEGDGTPIYAPAGWDASKIADHFGAGNAMERRIGYQIGLHLPRGINAGMAYACDWDSIKGKFSDIEPTEEIAQNKTIQVDGVDLEFYLTPDTETKAHTAVYVKNYKVLYLGDNLIDTLHNIQNIRGIPVRHAGAWGDYLYDIATKYGKKAVVVLGGHGRPHFNTVERPEQVEQVLLHTAAAYKYIHNQALHYANMGVTINELSSEFVVPEELSRQWYVRQNYGNYSFNARGTVAKYSGFYDGNPVNLNPLSKRNVGQKLIEYIGSEEAVLEKAKEDFAKGEYQWVAEITNQLIYANPKNVEARYLCADAFEQLGYQQETATWRNSYLEAAQELRDVDGTHRPKTDNGGYSTAAILCNLTISQMLDHIGIALDGSKAGKENIEFVLQVDGERHLVHYFKGALLHKEIKEREELKDLPAVTTTRAGLLSLDAGKIDDVRAAFTGDAAEKVYHLAQYVTDFTQYAAFNLVED